MNLTSNEMFNYKRYNYLKNSRGRLRLTWRGQEWYTKRGQVHYSKLVKVVNSSMSSVKYLIFNSVADADPGSGVFLTPGSENRDG
jgi:hypothetical protein